MEYILLVIALAVVIIAYKIGQSGAYHDYEVYKLRSEAYIEYLTKQCGYKIIDSPEFRHMVEEPLLENDGELIKEYNSKYKDLGITACVRIHDQLYDTRSCRYNKLKIQSKKKK